MRVATILLTLTLPSTALELIDVQKIGGTAPHSAFTDLARFNGQWFCAWREASRHVSPDGAIRIVTSPDFKTWTPASLVTLPALDLRDPKLTVTPDGRLMLTTAAADRAKSPVTHQSNAWFSKDGAAWDGPYPIGDPDVWLWRVTWNEGVAWSVGYGTRVDARFARLYRSKDGIKFERWADFTPDGYPNESAILFRPDGAALCLLRRDQGPKTALLGESRPPYREWKWRDLGARIGGPQLIAVGDRLLAGGRLYDGRERTSLAWIDAGGLRETLSFASNGDSSYPGMVIENGVLHVSYYSSHEGKSQVYAARVGLRFRGELWQSAKSVYDRTLDHPFLRGLADGTLPESRFRHYLAQDALYLREFSAALGDLAAKAPRAEWAATLRRHAAEALAEAKVPAAGKPAPTNAAYTRHLRDAVRKRPFAEGLAAMLPCYWIYQEVGKELARRGSPKAEYKRWIDQYADPAYAKSVDEALAMIDAVEISAASRTECVNLFATSATFEWLFWDMAWREESPPR